MSNIKKILEEKVSEFNSRIKDEPKFSGVIEGKERSICISVSDREVTPETPGLSRAGTFSRFSAGKGAVDILQCRAE